MIYPKIGDGDPLYNPILGFIRHARKPAWHFQFQFHTFVCRTAVLKIKKRHSLYRNTLPVFDKGNCLPCVVR